MDWKQYESFAADTSSRKFSEKMLMQKLGEDISKNQIIFSTRLSVHWRISYCPFKRRLRKHESWGLQVIYSWWAKSLQANQVPKLRKNFWKVNQSWKQTFFKSKKNEPHTVWTTSPWQVTTLNKNVLDEFRSLYCVIICFSTRWQLWVE